MIVVLLSIFQAGMAYFFHASGWDYLSTITIIVQILTSGLFFLSMVKHKLADWSCCKRYCEELDTLSDPLVECGRVLNVTGADTVNHEFNEMLLSRRTKITSQTAYRHPAYDLYLNGDHQMDEFLINVKYDIDISQSKNEQEYGSIQKSEHTEPIELPTQNDLLSEIQPLLKRVTMNSPT